MTYSTCTCFPGFDPYFVRRCCTNSHRGIVKATRWSRSWSIYLIYLSEAQNYNPLQYHASLHVEHAVVRTTIAYSAFARLGHPSPLYFGCKRNGMVYHRRSLVPFPCVLVLLLCNHRIFQGNELQQWDKMIIIIIIITPRWPGIECFAIYQIVLGWKTYEYYYETDELPNPRVTQPKKKMVLTWNLGHFFPQQMIFCGLGLTI